MTEKKTGQETKALDYVERRKEILQAGRTGMVKTVLGAFTFVLGLAMAGGVSVRAFLVEAYSIPPAAFVGSLIFCSLGAWLLDPKETTKLFKWLSKFVTRLGGQK